MCGEWLLLPQVHTDETTVALASEPDDDERCGSRRAL